MNENTSQSERALTRFTLVVTLLISIVANVTHSVLADSEISLWLRVPGGVIWPTLTFLAIEIIVRVQWQSRWTHHLARFFILGPAIPAAIISYEHQRNLLIMMGETGVVPVIGPLAIDGLMIGCTLALLFTSAGAQEVHGVVRYEVGEPIEIEAPAEVEQEDVSAVVEEAEAITLQAAQRPARSSGEAALAVALAALRDGRNVKEAAAESGMSQPAVRKYAAVMRTLADDVNAVIDTRKIGVRASVVDELRAYARTHATR